MKMEVKIYTTPTCGYCHMAKGFLSECSVEYEEIDVSRDRAAAEEMVSLTGQMGVPVIVVDGQVVLGFDRIRLEHLLSGNGGVHFGVKVADASRVAAKFNTSTAPGVLVGAVILSSPGGRAGLRVSDIITEVDNIRISSTEDLQRALAGLTPGSRVSLVFLRNGEMVRSEIAL